MRACDSVTREMKSSCVDRMDSVGSRLDQLIYSVAGFVHDAVCTEQRDGKPHPLSQPLFTHTRLTALFRTTPGEPVPEWSTNLDFTEA